MTISRAELPVLSMHIAPSMLEISGVNSDDYSVELCGEASAASESDAKALLQEIKMTHDGQVLSLSVPQFVQERPSSAFLQIQAPEDAPITIKGEYAAMRVLGMHAAVHLSTTHARITLLDTTADVDAKVESGIVDFSGDRGRVRLRADWEINLDLTGQRFDGSLAANAVGPVRLLLPTGFASAFEATVRSKANFVCRADICNQVVLHKGRGEFVFTFGAGGSALRFTSREGPVVIDNVSRLPAVHGLH